MPAAPKNPRLYSAEDIRNLALFSEHLQRKSENDILDGETNVRIGTCKCGVNNFCI